MMAVLLKYVLYSRPVARLSDGLIPSLNDVTDSKNVAPDGQTIGGRMEKLCEGVAGDIRKCGNACEAYLK